MFIPIGEVGDPDDPKHRSTATTLLAVLGLDAVLGTHLVLQNFPANYLTICCPNVNYSLRQNDLKHTVFKIHIIT